MFVQRCLVALRITSWWPNLSDDVIFVTLSPLIGGITSWATQRLFQLSRWYETRSLSEMKVFLRLLPILSVCSKLKPAFAVFSKTITLKVVTFIILITTSRFRSTNLWMLLCASLCSLRCLFLRIYNYIFFILFVYLFRYNLYWIDGEVTVITTKIQIKRIQKRHGTWIEIRTRVLELWRRI